MKKRIKDEIKEYEPVENGQEEEEVVLEGNTGNSSLLRFLNPESNYEVIDDEIVRRGTDFLGREAYYPTAAIDPDEYAKTTILFGIIGLHRFKYDSKLRGVGYILTCGLMGIGYLADVLLIFLNSVRFRNNTYLLPNYNRKEQLKYLPLGILFSVAVVVAYYFILRGLGYMLYGAGEGLGEYIQNNPDQFTQFFNR